MARVAEEPRKLRSLREPPNNSEAEEAVLGSVILSPDAMAEVVELVKPEDFYSSARQRIYEILTDLYARSQPIDPVTALNALMRHGVLEAVGGPLYVHQLIEGVPTPSSAPYYAKLVSDYALLRRLIRASADIMDIAYSVPADPQEAADRAEALIYSVARRDTEEGTIHIKPIIDAAIEEIEQLEHRTSALTGLETHFRDIDAKLSGLQKGNLVILAARPSIGKSALAVNIARNVAVNSRQPVLFFSVEMSRWELGMRLLCSEARVPMSKVRAGRVVAEEWSRFVEAGETLHEAPLFFVDSGHLTLLDVRARARRLRSRLGALGLIVVDYLQLMSHHVRVESRQQEIAEISRGMKMLAKELDVPVLALSQLNREPERRADGRPQLADLRESGSLEQDADVVLFIHRDKNQDGQWVKGVAEVHIAKHRNGPTGKVELSFNEELIQFANLYKGSGPS
jgi:replicative DNA helicase